MHHFYNGSSFFFHFKKELLLLMLMLLLSSGKTAWAQLNGTYYVGTSASPDATRTYVTLPAAMTALSGGIAANASVSFVLLDASYALGATPLTVPAPAVGTGQGISIVPNTGISPVITGSSPTGVILLDGTDYLTINGNDGSGNRAIVVRNAASGPAVLLRNDATNNALRFLTLESANTGTNSGTVYFGTTTGTTGNDSNILANCEVKDGSAVPANAVFSLGTGAAVGNVPAASANSDNTVLNCIIYNFTAGGVFLNDTGSGGAWTVSGTSLYQTATRTAGGIRAIRLTSGGGHVVTNNNIYQQSGTITSVFYGIAVVGGATGAIITGNSIGGSATGAGGTAMGFTGTGLVYPFYLSLGAAPVSSVQGNLVRNIGSVSTGTTYGIDLAAGTANIGTTTANTFGSATTGMGISNAGPIYGIHVEAASTAIIQNNTFAGLSTTAGLLAGVYLNGSGASTVSGNTITRLSSNLTTAAVLAGINSTGTGVVTITNNALSDLSQSGLTGNLYGIQSNGVAGSNVTDNAVTNVTYSGTTAGNTAYGIFASGNNTIGNNTVTTVQATGSSKTQLRGIFVGGTGATPTVTGNVINGVLNATTGSAVSTVGLLVGPTSGTMGSTTVRGNRISNMGTTNTVTTTSTHTVAGLLLGSLGTGSLVERNRVWNVYGSTAGTGATADQVLGLGVQSPNAGSTSSATYANNQISLAAGTATQRTYGLQDLSAGGTNNFYYNSVYMAPAATGTASSYAYFRSDVAAPPTTLLRNNLLYNGRTAATGAAAYAIGTASTTNWAAATSDYNLLVNSDAATVGNWGGTALSFADWKAAQPAGSGGDASSLSVRNTTVPATNLFVDVTTGNLDLNPANAEAWYANGNGVQLPGQTSDYGSATTGRSTTVAAGGTDIGSNEITPTSTPPSLTASAAPAAGGTQVLSLGGRTLATITYGAAGTVPTALTARYYSGTNPVVPASTTRYANSFLDVTATGGSGYTYDLVLSYDDALLGTIAPESNQRLARRNPDGTYSFFATSVPDAAANTLTATGLSSFGQFFGADQASPLPVTLSSFSVHRREANAQLDWVTASEINSAGYEVQVATDGRNFRRLGFIRSGMSTSSAPQFYQFIDTESNKTGVRYYRLRQLDLDGTATFSPVRAVVFGEATSPDLVVFPNPFTTTLTVLLNGLSDGNPVPVALTDATGRTMHSELVAVPAGTSRLEITALDKLPAGLYLLHITLAGNSQRLKVVKQ